MIIDPLLIGLSAKARYGKDETVEHMTRLLAPDLVVRRVAFADGVREEARELWGWNGVKDAAGRTLLQEIGAHRRAEDPEYWIKRAFSKIDLGFSRTIWMIPDVRYVNEANRVRELGGEVWRIERRGRDGHPFVNGLSAIQQTHPSETDLDNYPFDQELFNVGTIDDFHWEIGRQAAAYLKRHDLLGR